MSERWTVGGLAAAGAELLAKRGFPSSRLEADLLLAHALDLERIELYTRFDMPVDEEFRAGFRELIKRRLRHEPVAYLLGRREFLDWSFDVRPGVLIPRPETESLAESAAVCLNRIGEGARLLEVGVGSGCVVISALLRAPGATAVGIDRSPVAVDVTRANAERLGCSDRLELREADVFASDVTGPFDVIVSNPPYVTESERAELMPDVRDFEPEEALFWPGDGLEFHRRLLRERWGWLSGDGVMLLELPGRGGAEVGARFAAETDASAAWGVLPDLAGRDRVLVAARREIPEEIARHFRARDASIE